MLCCCSTHHVKVMKSSASLFSGSFTGLRGKDGMRNQFDLVLKFALDSLSPKRRRGLFPAHQPPCSPILSDEIQVLCCINLGELTEV